MFYLIVYILIWLPVHLFMRPKILGSAANLSLKGGVIFIANHSSLADPVMLAVMSRRPIHFMAKKELFSAWIGKLFFKSLLVFPVNRKTADLKSIKKALKLLKDGKAFGIFPEGKRSITDALDELEDGTAFIALKSGAPIVPVYIDPASYKKFRLTLAVGDKISAGDIKGKYSGREKTQILTNRMANALETLKTRIKNV